MAVVSENATADLSRRIAELERRLETALIERDAAIDRQTASALVNFRLQNELRAAQESQNASAEILRAIANTHGDAEHALQQIAETTAHFFNAASVTIRIAEGNEWVQTVRVGTSAHLTGAQPAALLATRGANLPATVYHENRQIHIPDLDNTDPSMANWPAKAAREAGIRTICGTPLRRGGQAIGAMIVYRDRLAAFTDDELALQQTFADQAVIAIENARLFNETQEALERQTATADILKVIASSPADTQPVFEAIATSANRLLGGYSSAVFRFTDGMACLEAFTPTTPDADEVLQSSFPSPLVDFEPFALSQGGKPVQITDTEHLTHERIREISRARGFRSMLFAPLMNDGEPIGVISVTRTETGTFADHHVTLLQTFAAQALIAIENTRLFNEVQARTRDLEESLQQQTATGDVLKVISRSVFDLQTVLDTLVESAYKLCGASVGLLYLKGDEAFECRAIAGVGAAEANLQFKGRPIRPGRGTAAERVILTGQVHSVTDLLEDPEVDPSVKEMIRNAEGSVSSIGSVRSTLAVPMTRHDTVIGVLVIARPVTGGFPQRQVELLQTFADQAVIAIENARLFDEVQTRTRELAKSLDDLRAAQDRLIQTEKLASLGQLTAGIAHEIKNPLNFVNNFAALSIELTDELNEALKQASIADKTRAEVDELTGLLKDNLTKVVQHGKRADSIVKNMLLHSREGSGEHRPTDINALVDESLNLAYHGARAEKPQFNVTLQRDFDHEAGMIEAFPQEITRVLLNLLSNGFYAVSKRKAEIGGGFEPIVSATTKGRTAHVEIRIRDNGVGIPSDVKERMFNPFFTTKPAGEGTGLGLSMSHDIIVKQHGGTIDVDTRPGEFTEFTIVLPRASNLSNKTRGQT